MNNVAIAIRARKMTFLIALAFGLAGCAGNTSGRDGAVTAVAVSPDSLTLEIGQSQALTAAVSGTGSFDTAVSWSSNDDSVATVDVTGVVTGVAAGSASITASSTSKPAVQGTVQVTVTGAVQAECPVPGLPVNIPDQQLRSALQRTLGADEITECELARVETINAQNHGAENLEGLQYATGLKELDLMANNVSDLSPITGLSLEVLKLTFNAVTDLSPLSNMTTLRELLIDQIPGLDDLSPLAALVNLEVLFIQDTGVTDLAVLEGFTELNRLVAGAYAGSTPSDYSVLTRLPELATLTVVHLPAQDLSLLKEIPKLTSLQLRTIEPYADVSEISGLTQLESLTLMLPAGTELTALGGMTNLTRLNVADSFVTDLSPLLPLDRLESVDVRHNCLPANLQEDSAYIELMSRGVELFHDPQRTRGC